MTTGIVGKGVIQRSGGGQGQRRFRIVVKIRDIYINLNSRPNGGVVEVDICSFISFFHSYLLNAPLPAIFCSCPPPGLPCLDG